ncbi:hypothetical protein [Xanthocytophaga flava]|uniref:hypothetical protein n=1 Tax=Xanthocytophaga flava TaxID=3048013 RepID=UPI0028D56AB4|nr:hypothetical protein [Xanthocytophaga flavus]MDJ1468182.1 hypothetical protein [Xanthocytophaga flavus]
MKSDSINPFQNASKDLLMVTLLAQFPDMEEKIESEGLPLVAYLPSSRERSVLMQFLEALGIKCIILNLIPQDQIIFSWRDYEKEFYNAGKGMHQATENMINEFKRDNHQNGFSIKFWDN